MAAWARDQIFVFQSVFEEELDESFEHLAISSRFLLNLGYLKDSNAAEHSIDSDIFTQ